MGEAKKKMSKIKGKAFVLATTFLVALVGGIVFFLLYTNKVLLIRRGAGEAGLKKTSKETKDEKPLLVEGSKELPENFPKDFPLYPNASLTDSFTARGEKTEGLSTFWETEESIAKVGEYYKAELENAGWNTRLVQESEDSVTLSFEKGTRAGFIGVTSDKQSGKTVISVTIGVR